MAKQDGQVARPGFESEGLPRQVWHAYMQVPTLNACNSNQYMYTSWEMDSHPLISSALLTHDSRQTQKATCKHWQELIYIHTKNIDLGTHAGIPEFLAIPSWPLQTCTWQHADTDLESHLQTLTGAYIYTHSIQVHNPRKNCTHCNSIKPLVWQNYMYIYNTDIHPLSDWMAGKTYLVLIL